MRELFEMCPEIQFFKLFLVVFEGSEFGWKTCKMVYSYLSGTTWKNSLLKP